MLTLHVTNPLLYACQWYLNLELIAGAIHSTYTTEGVGPYTVIASNGSSVEVSDDVVATVNAQ